MLLTRDDGSDMAVSSPDLDLIKQVKQERSRRRIGVGPANPTARHNICEMAET
jgi:hypothetical protein